MSSSTLKSRVSEGTFLTSFQQAMDTPDFKLSRDDEEEPRQTPLKSKIKKPASIEDHLQSVGNGYFVHKEKNCYFLKSKKEGDPKAKHLVIPGNLYEYLKPYQREGIAWLWRLHERDKLSGGILGDDMG